MLRLALPILTLGTLLLAAQAAAQTAPADATPIIRSTTSEVVLDFVAHDKRGRPIKNLKPDEVEIFEDGVRQKLLSFHAEAVHHEVKETSVTEVKTTHQTAVPPSRPLVEVAPVCVVLHNISPTLKPQAVAAVQEFLKSALPPEAYVAFFVLDDHLKPVLPFTKDHAAMSQALGDLFTRRGIDFDRASEALVTASPNEAVVNVSVNGHSATADMQVNGGEVASTVITGAEVSNSTGANRLRGDQVRERSDFANIEGAHETDRLITMIKDLATLPGRKTVLLVSGGFVGEGDPDWFQSILDRATKAGITVYALDPTGLKDDYNTIDAGNLGIGQAAATSRRQTSANQSLTAMKNMSRQGDDMRNAIRSSDVQASLRGLAEGTGGFLIANTGDYKKPFQKITDDLDFRYEATYRPASDRYDGRFRKLEVKVARADLDVQSRSGYFAMPDLKDSGPLQFHEAAGLAILNETKPSHDFDFRTKTFHFPETAGQPGADIAFAVPGGSLAATPDAAHQSLRLHVSLLALVKDATGQVVDKFSQDSTYEIPAANREQAAASPITFTHPVTLAAGNYTVETAFMDRESGRTSAGVSSFNIPNKGSGLGLSSVVLVERAEAVKSGEDTGTGDPLIIGGKERLVPLLTNSVPRGVKPMVYFVVVPDKSSKEPPRLTVAYIAGGKSISKTLDLPAPDASGNIPVPIPAFLVRGDCEVRITAQQGQESATGSVKYTVPN